MLMAVSPPRPSSAPRGEIAALIQADPREIVFTSGATEANNLAIKGAAHFARAHPQNGQTRDHIVALQTEHKCVLESCRELEREGFAVTYLPVQPDGLVSLAALEGALSERTLLVSVMAAHNEIGVIQPLAEIGALCRSKGALFHTDAAQAFGKIPLDVGAMKIDLLSISGHKVYGPKGVGALYIRRRPRRAAAAVDRWRRARAGPAVGNLADAALCRARPGGGDRRCRDGRRSGTAPPPQRRPFCENLARRVPGPSRQRQPRSSACPAASTFRFPGISALALIEAVPSIAISTGSACTSASVEPSYVLRALGLSG